MSSGRSGLLALVEPFPHSVVEELVRQATRRKMQVVIDPNFLSLPVDAALLYADVVPPTTIDAHLTTGTPLILLGEAPNPRCDHVTLDPARAAVEHLLSIGRQRIAAVGVCPAEAMDRAGLSVPGEYLIATAGRRPVDGYRAARALLEHRPDAIFCDDDRLALGTIRAIADAGLHVPGDVAVVGVGDSDEGRYSRPSLTTVAVDSARVARQALDLVEARLACPSAEPGHGVVQQVVVPRESTRPST